MEGKLEGSAARPQDEVGNAVVLAEDEAFVGAPGSEQEPGAVYTFEYSASEWTEAQILRPSDGKPGDAFGVRMALASSVLVITSYRADSIHEDAGAAYVFRRVGGGWAEEAKLVGSGLVVSSQFGSSTVIVDEFVAVSTHGPTETVHLFREESEGWLETQVLAAPGGQKLLESYGLALAAAEGRLYVGAPSANVRDVKGAGAVYVYKRVEDAWMLDATITQPVDSPYKYFGISLDADESRLIVGAYGPALDQLLDEGAAYLFSLEADSRSPILIEPPGGQSPRGFGVAVALRNEDAFVGASDYDTMSGQAFAYRVGQNGIEESMAVEVSDTDARGLGRRLFLHDGRAIVGAPWANGTGAAYVLRKSDVCN